MNVLTAPRGLDWRRASAQAIAVRGTAGALLLAGTVGLTASSCKGREKAALPSPLATTAALAPAPELVLGFRVGQPEFIYSAIRGLTTRPLPLSLQVALPSLLGLSPALSGRFAGGQDWLGVVAVEEHGAVGWAVGVPVLSGRELVAELSLGAEARLRAQPEVGWTRLSGAPGGFLGPLTLGISGNHLMFGTTPTAVSSLAPWLAHPSTALAPQRAETGVSARLFASGLTLQALHAHFRETANAALGTWSRLLQPPGSTHHLSEVEHLVNDAISAYLGALQAGDAELRWDGRRVTLRGNFRLSALPPPNLDRSSCPDITSLPANVKFWIAGSSGGTQGANSPPDWQSVPGAWQGVLFEGFAALATAFEGRVRLNPNTPLAAGPWVIGWREERGASTALGVLSGVPLAALEVTLPMPTSQSGSRIQSKTRDGKVLEWAWAARGAGIATAFGAELGPEWDDWVRGRTTTGWPQGLSPQLCDGLLFAAGTHRTTVFSVSRAKEELHVQGDLDLSLLDGWLR